MKLNIYRILFPILSGLALFDYLILVDVNYLYFRAIFCFLYIITVPGFLLMLVFKIKNINFWEYLCYTIGLSISFLIFSGLVINQILPLFHILKPLARNNILILFNLSFIILSTLFLFIGKKPKIEPIDHSKSIINTVAFSIPMLFPIMSVFGAILLNNGGPNTITLLMLILASIYVFFITLFRSKISSGTYFTSLLLMGLSFLFMYSLRSNYLIGWDVQSEYRVFTITKDLLFWSVNNIRHAYNTTLSITILPTVISEITGLAPLYIFKWIYPIIFAFSAPTIFLIVRSFSSKTKAFLSALFFIFQFQFMQQMPALARQEIAMLFFILSLLVIFSSSLPQVTKKILFIVFGLSLIVSHYSTAYITVGLYLITYFLFTIYRIFILLRSKQKIKIDLLSFKIVTLFTIFTFFWYGLFTGSASYLAGFTNKVFSNLTHLFTQEGKSEQAKISIIGLNQIYTTDDVSQYQKGILKDYKDNIKWINYYPEEKYRDYTIYPKYPDIIPTNNSIEQKIIYILFQIDQKLIKLSIVITIVIISILFLIKKKHILPKEFLLFSWIFLFFIIITATVPYVSIGYNIERLYQQSLVILAYFAVVGLIYPFKFRFLNKTIGYSFITIVFLYYFLTYAGITAQLLGGSPNMNLNNFGEEYERFYPHKAEKDSAMWLSKNIYPHALIFSDWYGQLRLQAFTGITEGMVTELYPGIIDKYGYVYSTYANEVKENVRVNYQNEFMVYNFPKDFLNSNKNLVYSNKSSVIYK